MRYLTADASQKRWKSAAWSVCRRVFAINHSHGDTCCFLLGGLSIKNIYEFAVCLRFYRLLNAYLHKYMSVGLPLHTKSQDQSANLKCHQTPHMSEITMVSGYVSVAVGSHEFSKRGMCQYKKECVTWSSADMSFYKAVPCYLHATWRNDATAMSIKNSFGAWLWTCCISPYSSRCWKMPNLQSCF